MSEDKLQYLSLCRFYHGEEKCPYRDAALAEQGRRANNMATAWEYESWWVERPEIHDSDETRVETYKRYGYEHFFEKDGVDIRIKALMYNRIDHQGGDFKKWYMTTYHNVPLPCRESVLASNEKWDSTPACTEGDKVLARLFNEEFSGHNDLQSVLTKAAALDSIYRTHVLNLYEAAAHIVECDIDELIKAGKPDAVYMIKDVPVGKKTFHYYSFATKYCSFSNPSAYPIFDRNVELTLELFRDCDHFAEFSNSDLKDYGRFKGIIDAFRRFYKLEEFSYKELDHYLWDVGKEIIKAVKVVYLR